MKMYSKPYLEHEKKHGIPSIEIILVCDGRID